MSCDDAVTSQAAKTTRADRRVVVEGEGWRGAVAVAVGGLKGATGYANPDEASTGTE